MPRTLVSRTFDPARWDELRPGPAVQSSQWLSVMLSRLPGEPLVARYDRPDCEVGFTGAVVADPAAYEAYNPWVILRAAEPVFAEVHACGRAAPTVGDAADDILPCALLVSPGYIGDPVGPGASRTADVRACLAGICAWARDAGMATVSVLYTTPASASVVEPAVASLGGESFGLTSRSALRVTWPDWPGRLAALARDRRAEVQRQLRRLAERGCAAGPMDPRLAFDQVIEARCALLRWYGQAADPDGERQRLRSLIDVFGPGALLFGTHRDGRLLACALFVAHGRTLQNVYAGTTPEGRDTPYAHLAATYHAPARFATSDRFDVIDYGVGHADTKKVQGCAALPMRGHLISLRAFGGK